MLFLAGLVIALPSILSLPALQTKVQQALSRSLKRPVFWRTLSTSWQNGLLLQGLCLGTGPAPLLKANLGDVAIVPTFAYRDGRLRVDLDLRISSVAADLAPGPPKPPKPYKEPFTSLAEAVQRFQGMDWPLPLDLGVRIRIEPVTVVYFDPKSGRRLTLSNFTTRLDMPSLADQPVRAEVRGDLALDGHRLEGIALTADLQGLVTPGRRLRPAGSQVSLKATLPGSSLTLQGGLESPEGFAALCRLDLPRLMVAAGPLLPPAAPSVQGEVGLDLRARVDAGRNLQAALKLNGSRIALSGGRLRQGRIGPLDLRLGQQFVSHRQREQVRFTAGEAAIGTLMNAAWDATVDRPSRPDRDLTARLGPVRLDLRQALAVAAPLLPPQFPVKELTGELLLKRLDARLQGRANRGEATVGGLGVTLPRLRLALAKGGVALDGAEIAIDRATVPLTAMRPTALDAALSWGVTHAAVTGPQPLRLDRGRGNLQLAVRDLDLKSRSPRRVTGTIDLKQSLELERVNLERKLAVTNLYEQFSSRILARGSGEIEVAQPELKLSAASLQAAAGTRQLMPLPLSALLTAARVRLPAAKGAPLVVDRASLAVSGGDFLKLAATGSVTGTGPQQAATDGTLTLDLGRILPLAAPFLPTGATAGGVSSLAWKLAAPLKPQPLPATKNPLVKARRAAGLIEQGEMTLSLANQGIAWPLASGSVRVNELRTAQPIRLVLPGSSGKITLGGTVTVAGLSGLPGTAGQLPPQSGSLSLNGELTEWRSLRLHEELQLLTLGLVQQADATVSRFDTLLEKPDAITAAALLQRLDGLLSASVAARFPGTPTPLPGGMELSGAANVGVRAELTAGRKLRLKATAATRDFGLRLKNGTVVEGVRADLLIDRTYALAKGEAGEWTPLSASLVRPPPERMVATGAGEIANRVREDLRGQQAGSRRFTIRRIVTAGKTPLELTALEGDLLFTPEEMGLSFFQTEALGGTLRLRGMLDLRPEVPTVSAACSFSNLETFMLLPPDVRLKSRTTGEETAVTGELSLDAPLATGQREFLEGIRMRLNLRRIGRETLERALFSLDPYERNEQVVAQRKLLRNGSLNWLRAGTLDGSFSLEGEVAVKGITVTLPPVERIRLADLPLKKQLATTLGGVKKLRAALDLVRADTLTVGPDGKISLKRRGNE